MIRFLKLAYKYAYAIEFRLFLILDYVLQARNGKSAPIDVVRKILRQPSTYEDFVNLLCFLDPEEEHVLIDAGANVGEFTADFIAFFPKTKAYLFEPVRTTFKTVQRQYEGNPDIKCFHCALSASETRGKMFLGPDSTLSSLEKFSDEANANRHMEYEEVEEVECKTLDSFNIHANGAKLILKVDVQGHEVEVFEGADRTLSEIDACIVECSFADEYAGREPSFAVICERLRAHDLYPIIFQNIGRAISNYGFERDVIFVKRPLLRKVYFENYGRKSGRGG